MVLAVMGCSSERAAVPVDQETMIAFLVDLHLERARADVEGGDTVVRMDSILSRHGIAKHEFQAAMTYYAHNPDVYVSLLDTIIDRMRAMRPQADVQSSESALLRSFRAAQLDTAGEEAE